MTKKLKLTKAQADEFIADLYDYGEVEIVLPAEPKKPSNKDYSKVGMFTVTRYEDPKTKEERIRIGFKYDQYFKRRFKRYL